MKKYMNGNLVKFRGKIYKIITATLETVDIETDEIAPIFRNIDIRTIEDIPLSDDFFLENGYKFDSKAELFIACDYYGPAIKRKMLDIHDIEYSVAGIIVRTVDEFQNLMNIMHCEKIADRVVVIV